MSVCFDYIDNILNAAGVQQIYRMLELESALAIGPGNDASKGAVARAVRGGHCALSAPPLTTRDVLFVVGWNMKLEGNLRVTRHTIWLNGTGYGCCCTIKANPGSFRNDTYTMREIVALSVNPENAIKRRTARMMNQTVRSPQESFSPSEMNSSEGQYELTPPESNYHVTPAPSPKPTWSRGDANGSLYQTVGPRKLSLGMGTHRFGQG